tara:strand:- start:87 stop:1508 length:1422 start_codon:yes stop_codon:yes gene_type:complete
MKNIYKFLVFSSLIFTAYSCEDIVDDINENPNDLTVSDVGENLFLTGGQLANIQLQCGHLNRVSGMYSGQLIGFGALYSNIYGYNFSTGESNSEWRALYGGVMTNMRHIVDNSDSALLRGIAMIIEGHAFGTGASLWGGIPYSEAGNSEIDDPVFDSQVSVYSSAIALLDQGINTLNGSTSELVNEDIYFNGDKDKWIAAANTLKARFYLHQKDYSNALSAAQNGISSASGDMKYKPGNAVSGDTNLFWTILAGSRSGDLGNNSDDGTESYLLQILDASNALSRNHSKTDETARRAYYMIDAAGSGNNGIIQEREPQNMVTFFENKLIMAEAAARSGGVSIGLTHLNELRDWLNGGGNLNASFAGEAYNYSPFVVSDFDTGGIENPDNISAINAFLREVIEERYVSGFGMHMPYNDARRLRKSDNTIAVPFVMVDADNTRKPERMPYAQNELNSNSNAPDEDPGIFAKTEVNQ